MQAPVSLSNLSSNVTSVGFTSSPSNVVATKTMTFSSNVIVAGTAFVNSNLSTTGASLPITTSAALSALSVRADNTCYVSAVAPSILTSGDNTALPGTGSNARPLTIYGSNITYDSRFGPHALLNGNVGIGTSTPAYPLDVSGTARIGGNTVLTGSSVANASGNMFLSSEFDLWLMSDNNSNNGGAAIRFGYGTSNSVPTAQWGAWTATGLGIGTQTPAYLLDVNGSVRVNQGNGVVNKLLTLWDAAPADPLAGASNFYGFGINGNKLRYQTPPAGTFHSFFVGSSEVVTLSATGLGVSKTPSYSLDVAGDINLSGVLRVNGAPFSTNGGGTYTFYSIAIPTNQTYNSDTQLTLLDYANFGGTAVNVNVYTGKQLGSTGIYLLNDNTTIYNSLGSDAMLFVSNRCQSDAGLGDAQRILRLYSTRTVGTFNYNIFTKWYHGQPFHVYVPAGARIQFGFSATDNGLGLPFTIYGGTLKVAMMQTL